MTNENSTLETLLSRLLTVQSKLEEESNALDALIKIAYHYADNENTDLRSLLDAFKTRVDAIKMRCRQLNRKFLRNFAKWAGFI